MGSLVRFDQSCWLDSGDLVRHRTESIPQPGERREEIEANWNRATSHLEGPGPAGGRNQARPDDCDKNPRALLQTA